MAFALVFAGYQKNTFARVFTRICLKSKNNKFLDVWLYHKFAHNQVYGIRDHTPGIGIIDLESRVTSYGIRISHFLCVFEGSGIELFRYFIINSPINVKPAGAGHGVGI